MTRPYLASERPVIVVCDDDDDDRQMIERALRKSVQNELQAVEGGEQLLGYLEKRVQALPPERAACCIVLLDLNMPRMSGYDVLVAMKADPVLRLIPVVVLTTSEAEEHVVRSYDLGASAYVTKPVTFDGFVRAMQGLGRFWFDIAQLP